MKNAVIIVLFLGMVLFDGAILQKDVIFECRMNIKSKTGELKGWMRKDFLLGNRINVYDKYGNKKGFWVKDILSLDTWFFNKSQQ